MQPRGVFLDVHMPGLNGIDAARSIGRRAQIVFVTAYEQYAVQAFEQGAIDYLVKPFDERLADTVQRLKARLRGRARRRTGSTVRRAAMAARVAAAAICVDQGVSVGSTVRLIPVEQAHVLRSDEKYTLVVWAAARR